MNCLKCNLPMTYTPIWDEKQGGLIVTWVCETHGQYDPEEEKRMAKQAKYTHESTEPGDGFLPDLFNDPALEDKPKKTKLTNSETPWD